MVGPVAPVHPYTTQVWKTVGLPQDSVISNRTCHHTTLVEDLEEKKKFNRISIIGGILLPFIVFLTPPSPLPLVSPIGTC